MSIRLDISKGIDPVPVFSDIRNDIYIIYCGGNQFIFDRLPFTTIDIRSKSGRTIPHADRELVLKHADKARVTELARLESVRG